AAEAIEPVAHTLTRAQREQVNNDVPIGGLAIGQEQRAGDGRSDLHQLEIAGDWPPQRRAANDADRRHDTDAGDHDAAAIGKGDTQAIESLAEPSAARTFAARTCRCWLLVHCHQIKPPPRPRAQGPAPRALAAQPTIGWPLTATGFLRDTRSIEPSRPLRVRRFGGWLGRRRWHYTLWHSLGRRSAGLRCRCYDLPALVIAIRHEAEG